MKRLCGYVSAGLGVALAPLALSSAQAQQADQPGAIVCQLLDNCSDAAATASPDKRPVRRSDVRGFSLARPKSTITDSAPVAVTRGSRATASRTPAKARVPHGQYDLRVSFMTGSAEVSPLSRDQIGAFASALKDPRLAERRVRIEGHTDSTGSAAKNQDLSERRAKAIADMLASDGIDSGRLDVRGYGSSHPLPGTSASNGANRRVMAVLAN